MSELADSAIDHIGKFLDNTGIRDYVWVACWLLGTYSIYIQLMSIKKGAIYTADELKRLLPFNAFLVRALPAPLNGIGGVTSVALWQSLRKALNIAQEGQ